MIMTTWKRIPPLFRFLALNCVAGIAASWLFLAGLLWLDTGGLRTLLTGSPDGAIAIALLAGGFAVTFGSAAMGTAVWLMPYDRGRTGGGRWVVLRRGRRPSEPVRVAARPRPR